MAMLTTFNEVNMKPIMDLRSKYKDMFEKKHNGVRLGFMSFFVKAATEALKRQPGVNASIDGNDIVYHGYQDIGVAVSSDRGLVVPVLRNAEFMSLAEVEGTIADFGKKAKAGKLTMEDMQGGTFTISNGGVFGSLLSTPIVIPPQTAILGMHKIQERPMAVNGPGSDPADDVSCAVLRPSPDRWQGSRDLPGHHEGPAGRPGSSAGHLIRLSRCGAGATHRFKFPA